MRTELENWHDWTDPDFFEPDRSNEQNVVRLFMRQLLPSQSITQKTKLTLTGWFLILVSLGIGTAAYNTSSNILFMTLSLMLSSLILSGILSLVNFRKLDWSLSCPSHLRVGELGIAEIKLTNGKTIFPSMSFCFLIRSPLNKLLDRLYLNQSVAAGETLHLEWMFTPEKRGRFNVAVVGVESLFPFGFLRKALETEERSETLVWPSRVDYTFDSISRGHQYFTGSSKRNPGMGSDLLNIRPYQAGDAPRLVHWRASARTGKLMVRQLAQEGDSGYWIFIDPDSGVWSEMGFERMCSLACSLSDDLFQHGRFDGYKIGELDVVAVRNLRDLHDFFDELAALEPSTDSAKAEPLSGHRNLISFIEGAGENVFIYVDQEKAGQTFA